MTERARAAYRYATTYLVLLRCFAQDRGARFWAMLAAVLVSAFVHPIPFLLVAQILSGTQPEHAGLLQLGWRNISMPVPPDTAVLLVFVIGTGAFLLSYWAGRLVAHEIVAWQGAMFWRLMGGAGHMARWDRSLQLGTRLLPLPVASRIDLALRGAFPIGRLIETGLRDFVMILVLGGLLLWQDAHDTLVLALLSLLFLPAYAVALSRLVRNQTKSNALHERLRQPVIEMLSSEVTRRAGQAVDGGAVPGTASDVLSQGYGSQSHLLIDQNAVGVVAGVHVFAAFYGVYLSQGASLASLPASKLSSLVLLVLLLRSLTGLIGLLSRLSRGYERLGQLRALLYPAAKPAPRGADEPGRFDFAAPGLAAKRPGGAALGPGDCIVFLAPDVSFQFQLLPLSNALVPLFRPEAGTLRHIPILEPADLPALLAGGVISGTPHGLKLPLAGTVPLRADPVDLARSPVVALSPEAWQQLSASADLAAAGRGRLLAILAKGRKIPAQVPPGALVVLSDGVRLVAAGDVTSMTRDLAAPAAGSQKPDEEEEAESVADL